MLKTRETRVEERKEEKRSEKRDRILRAAEAIFLDKGFHAASMNETRVWQIPANKKLSTL